MNPLNDRFYVSYFSLRRAVGVAGLLMPILVRLGAWHFEGITDLSTISAHYYTGMREVFVGTLVLAGALLACYRSPSHWDTILATVAGGAAIGIALFPMDPTFGSQITHQIPALEGGRCVHDGTCYIPHGILGYHGTFVGIFFALAFVLIVFRFPAFPSRPMTAEKRSRNRVYRICGSIMLLSGCFMWLFSRFKYADGMFWSESAAVMSFGVAWLVKGQLVLGDAPSPVAAAPRQPRCWQLDG